jgi:hypothetical protein
MSTLRDLTGETFRASRRFRLISLERTPAQLKRALGRLRTDPDCHGVLIPRGSRRRDFTAVNQNTARLLRALKSPGGLPAGMFGSDAETRELIAKLVLDGVLEMEDPKGFISGAAAYPLVFEGQPSTTIQGKTGRLSLDALKYAQALGIEDVLQLAARLYRFNTTPASPRVSRWVAPSVAEIEGCLVSPMGKAARWRAVAPVDPADAWAVWAREETGRGKRKDPVYKLYVSPRLEQLRLALPTVLKFVTGSEAIAFKLGSGPYGLVRPDKLVIYFGCLDDLLEMSTELRSQLAGIESQGVPFSASLDEHGLLSWGIDPPHEQQMFGSDGEESWRWWVACRLAAALSAATAAEAAIEPWQFALERLRLDGVDRETFAPRDHCVARIEVGPTSLDQPQRKGIAGRRPTSAMSDGIVPAGPSA